MDGELCMQLRIRELVHVPLVLYEVILSLEDLGTFRFLAGEGKNRSLEPLDMSTECV